MELVASLPVRDLPGRFPDLAVDRRGYKMMPDLTQQQSAKLVLLGEMSCGKSSLVLRFVKGQFFDYQVCGVGGRRAGAGAERELGIWDIGFAVWVLG